MHFVKDHPLDVLDGVRASVEHGAQDLRGHDEAVGVRVHAHVTGDEADICLAEPLSEVAVLLVAEGLDRRRVNGPSHVPGRSHGMGCSQRRERLCM